MAKDALIFAPRFIQDDSMEKRISSKYGIYYIIFAFVLLESINFGYRWVDDESWYLMPLPSIEIGQFNIPTLPGEDVFWPQPPLLTYLGAGLDQLLPLNVVTARLISLIFACLTIFLGYKIASNLYNQRVGLIVSALLAVDNIFFLAARIVRPEILVTFFLVAGIYCILQGTSTSRRYRYIALAGLCGAAGISSHPNGLIIPPTLFFLALYFGYNQKKLITAQATLVFSTILFLMPFVAWIIFHDRPNGFSTFNDHWLGRYGVHTEIAADSSFLSSMYSLVLAEFQGRYADFIQFPFRLHIFLATFGLTLLSYFAHNKLNKVISSLIIFQLLFFIFVNNSNPSVRYMTSIIPLVCFLAGYWIDRACVAFLQVRSAKTFIVASFLIGTFFISQLVGNFLYLWRYRDSDYSVISQTLNSMLPEKSVVYGGMFLWLGLRDHTLVPYLRTSLAEALDRWQPNIIIMDDWVMTGGGEEGEWYPLREELQIYLDREGKLLATLDAGFYGNLKIYALPTTSSRP